MGKHYEVVGVRKYDEFTLAETDSLAEAKERFEHFDGYLTDHERKHGSCTEIHCYDILKPWEDMTEDEREEVYNLLFDLV